MQLFASPVLLLSLVAAAPIQKMTEETPTKQVFEGDRVKRRAEIPPVFNGQEEYQGEQHILEPLLPGFPTPSIDPIFNPDYVKYLAEEGYYPAMPYEGDFEDGSVKRRDEIPPEFVGDSVYTGMSHPIEELLPGFPPPSIDPIWNPDYVKYLAEQGLYPVMPEPGDVQQ